MSEILIKNIIKDCIVTAIPRRHQEAAQFMESAKSAQIRLLRRTLSVTTLQALQPITEAARLRLLTVMLIP